MFFVIILWVNNDVLLVVNILLVLVVFVIIFFLSVFLLTKVFFSKIVKDSRDVLFFV